MARTATAWAELIRRLDYRKWVASGGDWNSGITQPWDTSRQDSG